MLDRDLAELYEVPTKVLNQSVKRNLERFPKDFMFQLNSEERKIFLRSQFVTLEMGKYSKYFPLAFTEQGVAMLSSVLRSRRAILVNIQIIRTFTRIRQMLAGNRNLRLKIEEMEKNYDKNFKIIFDTLKKMVTEEEKPKKILGFTDRS